MKANQGIKIIYLITLGLMLSACSLNSSDSDKPIVRDQLRTSRGGGGLLPNGGLAIDLPINNRPAPSSTKWAKLIPEKGNIAEFLFVSEGRPVVVAPWIIDSAEIFFWGDLNSTQGQVLQIGNQESEREYFKKLDTDNFELEITIWDDLTDTLNPTTNTKYDYLGYVYFGRKGSNKVGNLTGSFFRPENRPASYELGIKFSDARGDIILYFNILRQGLNSTLAGVITFRAPGSATADPIVLGSFSGLRACDFFKCQ